MDREALRWLSRRSDVRGLAQLAAHLLLLGTTGFIVWASRGTLWLAPAIVLHGVVLAFLFCPLHETIHRTAFATRRINDAVAWVCGVLLVLPPEYFRLFHFAHHRHTQDLALDPELTHPRPGSLSAYLWHVSGLPYWYDRGSVTVRMALTGRVTEPFVPMGKRAPLVREARALLLLYLLAASVSLYLRRADILMYWVLPVFCGQPVLRMFLLTEHFGCPFSDDMFVNTRTTYTSRTLRFLTWQMSFHAEHHAFPSVPFHALAAVNVLTKQHLASSAPGYVLLHRELLKRFAAARRTSTAHITAGKER
jgi:fatty acid desaturase